jgi:hypothetical protein
MSGHLLFVIHSITVTSLLFVIEGSRAKRRKFEEGTKRIERMRKALKVAEGQKSMKKVAEGGRRQLGDGQRQENELMWNESQYHRTEANVDSIECRTKGEAGGCGGVSARRSQKVKGRLGERMAGRDLLGVLQNKENEERMLDIQKRKGSGGSKSETPIEMKAVAIETIERRAKGVRSGHKKGQNWIWMR